jgi:predicted ABC-class ATPase
MKDMVKQIVDMDRKAREITDAAQLEKVNSEKEVAQKREEIRAEYLERARKRISLNEPKERAAAEEEWKTVAQKNAVLSQNLDDLYKEKGDEWVKTIVARVIGE